MAEPTGSLNLSQSLFQIDEKLVGPSKNFGQEFPSFINQSKLSTYFQDNPWPTVTFTNQFGMSPMGGPINYKLGPNSRPGNLMKPTPIAANTFVPSVSAVPELRNGVYVPNFMNAFPKNVNILGQP